MFCSVMVLLRQRRRCRLPAARMSGGSLQGKEPSPGRVDRLHAPSVPSVLAASLGWAAVTTSAPVVLIAEELAPSVLDVLGGGVEIRIDAEALAAAPNLKVVARAGIGLDNVDVATATERGVMVVNAPTSNIVSAAEHAVALLLAAARHIAAADALLCVGQWKRSKFTGVEVADKTVGVVGLGRIGVLVAQRLAAFGVGLVAYAPYIQPGRAAQLGVRLVSLEELLRASDFITIHLPKTPETVGLIGPAELATTKKGVIIVNAARGGLV